MAKLTRERAQAILRRATDRMLRMMRAGAAPELIDRAQRYQMRAHWLVSCVAPPYPFDTPGYWRITLPI